MVQNIQDLYRMQMFILNLMMLVEPTAINQNGVDWTFTGLTAAEATVSGLQDGTIEPCNLVRLANG